MKEKEFIAKIKLKEDKMLFSYVLDKYYQYKKSNISLSSNFLNDRELELLGNGLKYLKIPYQTYRPNDECERTIIYFGEYENFVTFYKINITGIKHSDVLGALFGCGFSYSMLGDIFILEDQIYITNLKKYDFLLETSLIKIGSKTIQLEKIKNFPQITRKFKNISISANSARLDLIISKLLKLSRKDTLEYMKKKKILLNYSEINKVVNLKEKDILSIEGYGKVIINEILDSKNNIRINIKKYC